MVLVDMGSHANLSIFLQLFQGNANATQPARTRWLTKYVTTLRSAPPHERSFLEKYATVTDAKIAALVSETLVMVLKAGDVANRDVFLEAVVFFTRQGFKDAVVALYREGFRDAYDEALVAACVGGLSCNDAVEGRRKIEMNKDFVRWLLDDCKASLGYRNGRAFRCAVRDGSKEICQILINSGADVQYGDDAALMLAAELGHSEVVNLLLQHGSNANSRDSEALRLASENGHLTIVRLFLDSKYEVNIHSQSEAALRRAASNGHQSIVELLLNYGADPNLCEEWEHSRPALVEAAVNGHVALVCVLAQKGERKVEKDTLWKALSAVCLQGRIRREQVVEILLSIGDEMFSIGWISECTRDEEIRQEMLDAAEYRELPMLVARLTESQCST